MFQTILPNYVATLLCQLLPKSRAQLPPNMNICARAPAWLRVHTARRRFATCYVVLMRLVINAEEREFAASTLDALIEELGMKGDRVAVELNREIVPRVHWSTAALKDGDRLEIVHFVGGGAPEPDAQP